MTAPIPPQGGDGQAPSAMSFVPQNQSAAPLRFTPLTGAAASQALTAVDSTTGAPIGLRAAVGAAATPAQQLQTIRQWQTAHGITADAKPTGDGNFVYSANGGPMILFRPTGSPLAGSAKNLLGWEAEHLSNVAELAGQIYGQATGTAGGMVAGGPAGAVAGGIGLGGLDASTAKGLAQTVLGKLFGTAPDTRTLPQAAGDAGASTLANALGAGTAMGTGTLLGKLGEMMTPRAQVPGVSSLAQTGQRLQNFADAGITPTAGMATQIPFLKQVELSLTADPLTSGTMRNTYANAVLGGQRAAQGASGLLAGSAATAADATSAASAPGLVQRTLSAGGAQAVTNFGNTLAHMEGALEDMTRSAPPIPPANTINYYTRSIVNDPGLTASMPLGSDPAFQRAQGILLDAQKQAGGLTFAQLQALRTNLDGVIDKAGGYNQDMAYTRSAVKNLEGLRAAVKDDLVSQAQQIDAANGFTPDPVQPMGPVATALNTHDQFVSDWHDSNKQLSFGTFQEMMNRYGATDPSALNTTEGGAQPKTSLVKTYQALRQHFSDDQYNALTSVWFANLGRSADAATGAETWDPATFSKNWNAAAPFRQTILTGTTAGDAAPAIARTVQAADNMATAMPGTQQFRGRQLLAPLVGGALAGGTTKLMGGDANEVRAASVLGSIGVPWAASRALTSPLLAESARALLTSKPFLDAVLPMTQAVSATAKGAAKLTLPMASRIWAIARTEPKLQGAIDDYMNTLGQSGVEIPDQTIFQRLSTPSATYQPRP